MNLVRLISWPYACQHRLRLILTASGIVLGVAVLVAIHTGNATVVHSFSQTVDRVAGATQLQVFASGSSGFSEEFLDAVRQRAEVQVAAPVIEQSTNFGLQKQESLLILGVDMLADSNLRQYDIDVGADEVADDIVMFLAQPDSLIITREFAQQNHLAVNSQISLPTAEGSRQFTVRGIMRPGGLASAFGGSLALMDIYAAQEMFGRGRSFDRIDVVLRPGFSVKDGQADLARVLGPGFSIEPPAARAQEFESLLDAYSRNMNLMSIFALLIGIFIIDNSFNVAVAQRRSEIGVLRALGATRRQIRWLFLIESTLVGLPASAVGVAFGLLLAWGSMKYISGFLQSLYGFSMVTKGIILAPGLMVSAFLIGVFTSVLAAVLPAQSAASIDPVQAFQKGRYQQLSLKEHWIRRATAVGMVAVSAACLWVPSSSAAFYIGYIFSVLAAILLAPTLVIWLARLLRQPAQWLRPVEGTLAADSLIAAPRRTTTTVGALMLSLAMVVALGGVSQAAYVSVQTWLDTTLNPDLFVSSSDNLLSSRFLFPPSMETELRAIPGVADVQGVRTVRISIAGSSRTLIATDLVKLFEHIKPEVFEGDLQRMAQLASQGQGVIISENFSTLESLHLQNWLEIPTPSGLLRLPIVGVIRDYTSQKGSLLIDGAVFQRYWKSGELDVFRVYLQSLASADDVKRRILENSRDRREVFVLTSRELKDYVLRSVNQWFGLTYLPILIAILVAVLGIANTLLVSVTDRRRELAILRAVGGLRRQVRSIVSAEALLIALIGLVIGIALGAGNLYYALEIARRQIIGVGLSYQFPWKITLLLFPAILSAAWVSAVWPGHSAVRQSVVGALEYE